MSLQLLLLFVAAAIPVCLSPGPDILAVVTRSITQGTRAGLVATFGFATGLIFHTTIAATGLALLLRNSPAAFRVVKYAGAAYLIYLAVRLVASRQSVVLPSHKGPDDAAVPKPPHLLRQAYVQSILMNALNPKVTVFFLAFLPKFSDPQAAFPFWLQMIVLGALFAVCTVATFGSCALLAGPLSRGMRGHPRAAAPLRWLTAGVFLVIAVMLILD